MRCLEEEAEESEQPSASYEPESVPYDEETQKLVDAATLARNQFSGKTYTSKYGKLGNLRWAF